MKTIILAGGKGEGLWPLSRKDYPKQFLEINGESFFYQTVKRCVRITAPEDIWVITASDYFFYVKNVLQGFGINEKNIIVEQVSKNTAASVLLALLWVKEKQSLSDEEIFFVCPSDQYLKDDKTFNSVVKSAMKTAEKDAIVTFGVEPLLPQPSYGYIRKGQPVTVRGKISKTVFQIKEFVEKPDRLKAEKLVRKTGWYWNTGMLLFSFQAMCDEYRALAPHIYDTLTGIDIFQPKKLSTAMKNLPFISIDRAIMEKTSRGLMIPAPFRLLDIGDWNLFYKMCSKDKNGNVIIGDVVASHMKNSLIISEKNLVACSGMQDMTIINSDDVTYVSCNKHVSSVKDIVSQLNKKNRKEAVERTTSYRPWGSYTVLETGPRYKIKRIVVLPGETLSLQMHNKRSEHWVVTRGIARVRIGDEMVLLQEGESTFVPLKAAHQLQNPGKKPLEIIEVQMGDYIGEDDIVRFEDKYGREKL